MTCAHRTRPFGSIVTVTPSAVALMTEGRLSGAGSSMFRQRSTLGMIRSGVVRVSVE
jgi:hypothetical protein